MRPLLASPLTRPLHYVANAAAGLVRFRELRQHYMAFATESSFEPNVTLFDHAVVHASSIGRHTYVGSHSVVGWASVGRFCCIGPGVRIGPGRHPTGGFVSNHPLFYSQARHTGASFVSRSYFEEHLPTRIGHDVWIGANAVICDGADLGDGAIVAAGAVVTKPVPPYAIVGGVPAERLRSRFSDDDVRFLLDFRWWDREDDWLAEHATDLHDVARLRALAR